MAGDYENSGRASRPSFIEGMKSLKGKNPPPKKRVDLLAERYAAGLDLWTGKPRNEAIIPVEAIEEDDDVIDLSRV